MGMSAEISFVPSKLGSLPARGGVAGTGMNDQEQNGWFSGGINKQVTVVADPLGSVSPVFRFQVDDGGSGWQFGGTAPQARAEYWHNPHDLTPGTESWHAWSWLFPPDFTVGSGTWCAALQLHGDDKTSPVQALDVSGGKLVFSHRENPVTDPWGSHTNLGPLPLGVRVYFLIHVKHAVDASGLVEFWHGLSPSFLGSQPDYRHPGPNVSGNNSWTKIGLYRDPKGGGFPTVAYLYGLGRAATFARATELAGWTAAPAYGLLNPQITRDMNGGLTLRWTSDPAADGYKIVTPTGTATAGRAKTSSFLGLHSSISVSISPLYAQASETVSYP